jgi:hypothetical protein
MKLLLNSTCPMIHSSIIIVYIIWFVQYSVASYNPGQNHLQHTIKTFLCGFFYQLVRNNLLVCPPHPPKQCWTFYPYSTNAINIEWWGKGGGFLNLWYYDILSSNWKCRRCFVQDSLKWVEIIFFYISLFIHVLAMYCIYAHCLWPTYVHNYIKYLISLIKYVMKP